MPSPALAPAPRSSTKTPDSAASAAAAAGIASTTLKFTAVTKARVTFTKTTFGLQETDVNSKGKIIGFDDLYITGTSPTSATVHVTFDTKGGFLYGVVTTTNGTTYSGKVTGGTGAFKGATGTITAKSSNGNKTAVTIVYS